MLRRVTVRLLVQVLVFFWEGLGGFRHRGRSTAHLPEATDEEGVALGAVEADDVDRGFALGRVNHLPDT